MKQFKADLHIHTLLSPCADLKMTPSNIVKRAKEQGLQIIGITDHNSIKNAKLVKRIAENEGIFVLTGAEITTREEVHCLAFFEHDEQLDEFQNFLDANTIKFPNPEGHFGYQPVVDENNNIIELVPYLLSAALNTGISDLQKYIRSLNGIFIPAHINRQSNGIFSELGIIPDNLEFDALEITKDITEKHARKHYVLKDKISLLCSSDAHFLTQIGNAFSIFNMVESIFLEIQMALNQKEYRFVRIL